MKEHKIGLLRTKEELVHLLAEKQRALKKAQQVSERLKMGDGLHVLTSECTKGDGPGKRRFYLYDQAECDRSA